MKIAGISFSHVDNSLQKRGLELLNEHGILDEIYGMTDFNMPICNSNKSDGVVPNSVTEFIKALDADVFVFAISEATSHYSAGFKNAMDWLVVHTKFNARLGTDYPITDKPIFVITFSPTSKPPAGSRHFDMTRHLLEKMGAKVIDMFVVNNSWNDIVPGGFKNVQNIHDKINAFKDVYDAPAPKEQLVDNSSLHWLKDYNRWDIKWKYEMKPVHRVNGMPWPRISNPETIEKEIVEVPLKEDYKLRSMDYLDTEEAKPIFETQADWIIKNNIKGIVDIGCRIGIVNDILHEKGYKNYQYMGFDTSPQPIAYANEVWNDYNNIEYRCASMYNHEDIKVNFDVDCVIWSGVLLYDPENHKKLFENLTISLYNAKHAIIQEPCKEQDPEKFLDNMRLNTIEQEMDQYKTYSSYEDVVVNCNIFSGKRRIAHICI